MERLELEQLEKLAPEIDEAISRTPGIDPWCSGVDWIIPVHRAFAPESEPLLLMDNGTPGGEDAGAKRFVLLSRYRADSGEGLIAGLEPLWGFACPLLGGDHAANAKSLAIHLRGDAGWQTLALPGLPADRSLIMSMARPLAELGDVGLQEGITRRIADLTDGPDAWLERRKPKFRRNLRNAQRRARGAGVDFYIADDSPDAFERIVAVEQRSWKGAQGDGITAPEMQSFYRSMTERLRQDGSLRCVIATRNGSDVGYILGGSRNARYRGLQLSYTQESAALSLGHLLQLHEIRRMSAEGVVLYDMGMDMEYKAKMADTTMTSVMLVVRANPAGWTRSG